MLSKWSSGIAYDKLSKKNDLLNKIDGPRTQSVPYTAFLIRFQNSQKQRVIQTILLQGFFEKNEKSFLVAKKSHLKVKKLCRPSQNTIGFTIDFPS